MHSNRIVFSFLLLLIAHFSHTQSSNGLILEDEIYETVPIVEVAPLSRGSKSSLKPWAPKPSDQGATPSCVGHAIANALSISFVVLPTIPTTNPKEIEGQKLSASFIYNQIKRGAAAGQGASLFEGFQLVQAMGDCYEKDFPNHLAPKVLPATQHIQSASEFRIKSYGKIDSRNIKSDIFRARIKGQIENASPVVIGIDVPVNWRQTAARTAEEWNKQPLEGHAMVIIGFNENGEFELMNSYGTAWGERGFIRLPCELVMEHLKYAYIAILSK